LPNIEKYLAENVIADMRQAIREAGGNEVFFVGYTEEDLVAHQMDVVARGNEMAVPAVLEVAREADVVIHNHPSGGLKPSNADLAIATQLDTFRVAFFIVDNEVEDIYVVVEPFAKHEIIPLETEGIQQLLQPDGPISKLLKGYEDRPQQIAMIDYVCRAFNQDKVATIEAGTGTGKTMAYLLPSIYWSIQNKQRVVISTNTINLQEQLVKKDIPLLQKALGEKFEAVLVKGRGNYVCLRKVDELETEFDLQSDEEEREELKNLIDWTKNSRDGSKADLAYIPREDIWEKIAAESDTCTRSKCPHFRACFVNKARRQAARANILVVNHHLLFADLALRHQLGAQGDMAVLPPYERIIFDEAHHLEDVATHYFGNRITRAGIVRILTRLHREQKSLLKGHLHNLRHRLSRNRGKISNELVNKIENDIGLRIVPGISSLVELTHNTMDMLYDFIKARFLEEGSQEIKLRLLPAVAEQLLSDAALGEALKDYVQTLKLCAHDVALVIEPAFQAQKEAKEDWSSLIIEIKAQAERLAAAASAIEDVIFNQDDETIRWLEIRPGYRGHNIVRFLSSPLDVSEMMEQAVYNSYGTVIMTSATLAVENKFDFLAERIGLERLGAERRIELILAAPFDYEKQAIVGIPLDIPDPTQPTFAAELSKLVFKALTISQGRAFVLFTSYGLLNMVYNQLSESLKMVGIAALKQGSENRHDILSRFRRDKTSVLFATDSFWEGVDVEGDALESVIITKLPFKVPKEPVIEARYEAIERRGGNAFMDYAVPLAVLKLKQGFGRLIRRKTDRGSVIIFDNRIIRKNYGKRFLASLPAGRSVIGPKEEVFAELKKFFS
jgi:ATP-dependent DNA helicase DinG